MLSINRSLQEKELRINLQQTAFGKGINLSSANVDIKTAILGTSHLEMKAMASELWRTLLDQQDSNKWHEPSR